MNEELQWCFAKSLAGHDKETVYIIKKMDSEYAYLTDGKNKLIDSPKKKKIKHIQVIKKKDSNLESKHNNHISIQNEDIKKAIESSAKELGIEVPEDEVDKLVAMMQKVSKVDVNVDALKKQAGEIYNKLKDAGIDLSNVDTKGLAQKIGDFFANIFEAIVRFFSGLFG